MSDLVLYDEMRSAIAKCALVDEVAGIKNKAAQLEAYARVRDDAEAQRQFAEIRLRACIRIGEISRDLPTAQGKRTDLEHIRNDADKSKAEILKASGISDDSAERYEQLTGGREQVAQQIAAAAAESYFATEQALSFGGLKTAVRQALVTALGEPAPKERSPKREPDLLVHFLYSANWSSRKHNFDPIALAKDVMEEFAQDDLDSCRDFIPLLEMFIQQLKERFDNVR